MMIVGSGAISKMSSNYITFKKLITPYPLFTDVCIDDDDGRISKRAMKHIALQHTVEADEALSQLIRLKQQNRKSGLLEAKRCELLIRTRYASVINDQFLGRNLKGDPIVISYHIVIPWYCDPIAILAIHGITVGHRITVGSRKKGRVLFKCKEQCISILLV